jgi:hypothetical protein
LRTPAEYAEEVRVHGEVKPFTDPAVRFHTKAYVRFVRDLHAIGYWEFTLSPKEKSAPFFVWKSGRKKIRLISGARRSNLRFKDSPGVSLCSAEGFSRAEIDLPLNLEPRGDEGAKLSMEAKMALGLTDVQDCFHRERAPFWLC